MNVIEDCDFTINIIYNANDVFAINDSIAAV